MASRLPSRLSHAIAILRVRPYKLASGDTGVVQTAAAATDTDGVGG